MSQWYRSWYGSLDAPEDQFLFTSTREILRGASAVPFQSAVLDQRFAACRCKSGNTRCQGKVPVRSPKQCRIFRGVQPPAAAPAVLSTKGASHALPAGSPSTFRSRPEPRTAYPPEAMLAKPLGRSLPSGGLEPGASTTANIERCGLAVPSTQPFRFFFFEHRSDRTADPAAFRWSRRWITRFENGNAFNSSPSRS